MFVLGLKTTDLDIDPDRDGFSILLVALADASALKIGSNSKCFRRTEG
jgi:hypothetical protein